MVIVPDSQRAVTWVTDGVVTHERSTFRVGKFEGSRRRRQARERRRAQISLAPYLRPVRAAWLFCLHMFSELANVVPRRPAACAIVPSGGHGEHFLTPSTGDAAATWRHEPKSGSERRDSPSADEFLRSSSAERRPLCRRAQRQPKRPTRASRPAAAIASPAPSRLLKVMVVQLRHQHSRGKSISGKLKKTRNCMDL